MTKPIKIIVKGTDHCGDDAPTVEDLLTQIQDFVFVLREVEGAIADDNKEQIVWRVTNASKNSPLTFEVTPYPINHAMNIDNRAEQVVAATGIGFRKLSETGERPKFFTDQVMSRAEKVFSRVTNGLASTVVDFSEYEEVPNFEITPNAARKSIQRIKEVTRPTSGAHRELGSVEGHITKVELDGYNRPIVWLRSRLDGQTIKCVSKDGGLDRIGHFEVAEVLRGMRVRIHGLLHYKSFENIATIDVEGVHVFEVDDNLPNFDKIVAPNFTGGVESSAYLEALRDDG